MKQELSFPQGFLFGAGTSSHQVEGNTNNDWTQWEKQTARKRAQESIARFSHVPHWTDLQKEAANPHNYISGIACDHYRRFEEDFDIAQSLGHNAHRFSIEWSRIEPSEGVFDEAAIEHYRKVLRALKQRGMTPFVTLWHFMLPVWLAEKGGLESTDFPKYFKRYSEKIAQTLGEDIPFWITLNEPDVIASHAYLRGEWPPQKKSFVSFIRVVHHLISAHKQSYTVIKQFFPKAQMGIAKHQVAFEMAHDTHINRLLQKTAHYFWNQWFLNRIRHHQDFIGLNHYGRNVIDNGFGKNPNERVTDFGWEFYPESLYQALMELKPYDKPIYITENGLADASDILRQEFIPRALACVHKAIADGADVRGYLHWSLLDNSELARGFWLRFGLVEVNYATQKRTCRPSALAYAEICKRNAL